MRKFTLMIALILPILLTACGSGDDDFQGRFIGPDGLTSYEFLPNGLLKIKKGGADVTTGHYQYDSNDQVITLSSDLDLRNHFLKVNDAGNLEIGDIIMSRGIDYGMLANSTWIGHQGQYSFALTFTESDEGMQTTSELVTYYDDDKTYVSQNDDSITRLSGNMMFVDLTQYEISDVSQDTFKVSIGKNSMVLGKHPKGTEIDYRADYQSIDEMP